MLIRRLVIASLIAGAASAQAGTVPTQAAQPTNVVSGWTTGNGTDVLSSGVLQGGNLNLVAGVAHSADASLADILYGKVAGSVEQVGGQTKLFFQRGIEANYLLASGHGILAATAGLGKSVVGSADGAIISDGVNTAPSMSGGGNNSAPAATNGGGGNGGGAGGSGSNGGGSNSGNPNGGGNGNGKDVAIDNGMGIGNGALNGNGSGIGTGNGGGLGNQANADAELAEVPEPSSIALMLLGMVGAGAMTRRRRN